MSNRIRPSSKRSTARNMPDSPDATARNARRNARKADAKAKPSRITFVQYLKDQRGRRELLATLRGGL